MTTVALTATTAPRLPSWAIFAAMLAAAGLPLYIHAPKVYADAHGVSLAALGTALFVLRLIDVVQDPALGWLAARLSAVRRLAVSVAVVLIAGGMVGLFAVAPPIAPLWWFALMLSVVFTAFSFLTICFYAEGVAAADRLPMAGHLRLARWRETGALLGICAAAVAPLALGGYAGFALAFAALALVAWVAMAGEWQGVRVAPTGFGPVLRDVVARRLLLIALVNAAPVAITSTLFLFFVESRLDAPGWEGAYLLLFFLCAALAAPVWGALAERHGAKRMLLAAMALSIAAFGWAVTLGPGNTMAFALICVISGAATGADMTLLPALFARRMAEVAPGAAEGFSLWAFVSKFTLALAAVAVLPTLEAGGFRAGAQNDEAALRLLALLYGGLPCLLKLGAVMLLARMDLDERRG
ncbi:MAG: sugar:cation symporter [Alphaproteobacteria bacterium HGW-Alphaproteobacteria-1]|jgi:GPH family glycoside/pentoside/hexuronide:cation symporter|nr:MAG: sugar:cation symporter [Alphaproteobacteria bacterium HGW-Alphaproteobacteria-1]